MVFHYSRFTLRAIAHFEKQRSTLQLESRFLSSQKVQLSTSPHYHKITPEFLRVEQWLGRTHPVHIARVLGRYGVSVRDSMALLVMGPHCKSASAKLDNGWPKSGLLCFTTVWLGPHLLDVPSQSHPGLWMTSVILLHCHASCVVVHTMRVGREQFSYTTAMRVCKHPFLNKIAIDYSRKKWRLSEEPFCLMV